MKDRDIDGYVSALVEAYVLQSKKKPTPDELILIGAAKKLFVNFLTNLNDIASCARVIEQERLK